jgi:hypothetical protein
MAVNYQNPAKQARMTATRDHFANGTLELLTSGDSLLVTFGLDATGGSVSAAGVWTLGFDATTVAASAAGTAAKAQLKTSGGTANLTGLTVTATGGGGDIVLNNTSIASAQNVTLSGATITHAT